MPLFNVNDNYQNPTAEGYYGDFGGAYIPEMLYGNVETLKTQYLQIMQDPIFQAEFQQLLKDYVGRPTPLFLAERLSKEIGATIYLKREDLCHTGAHKINNTIGQIILAQKLGKKKIIAEKSMALTESQAQLVESSRLASLGEMASSIAHEINNPLSVITARTTKLVDLLKANKFEKVYFEELLTKISGTAAR